MRISRRFRPCNLNGCVLYLPFYAYGGNAQAIWDLSGQGNHGVITGTVPYPGNPQRTSGGSTYNYGDFTATNAFFWSSLDLSPYAGTDVGFTPHRIRVVDGAGKIATGYIGAVGAGETLGSENVVDPGFDDDTKWNAGVGWLVATSKASATAVPIYTLIYQNINLTQYTLIKCTFSIDSLTLGTVWPLVDGDTVVEESSSGLKTVYYNAKTSGLRASGFYNLSATPLTAVFDSFSQKRITDPPSTAVHIVSSLNGTTRTWESIESGFNPNTIASWRIDKVQPSWCIGWYFDGTDDLVAHPSINFGTTHTLLYWFQAFSDARNIIHGGGANYQVSIDGTNIYYNAGTTELSRAHGGEIWNPTMIGIVRSGTTVQVFKNGVQLGTDQTLAANNNQTLTTLGSYDTPGTFLDGVIDETLGFTRAFSASEIKSYYELTRSRYGV